MKKISLTKKRIFDYWINFFPEIERDELENIICFADEVDIDNLEKMYDIYDNDNDFEAEKYADFDYCNVCLEKINSLKENELFVLFLMPLVNKQLKLIMNDESINNVYEKTVFINNMFEIFYEKAMKEMYKSIVYEFNYFCKISDRLHGHKEHFCEKYSSDSKEIIKFYNEYQIAVKMASKKMMYERQYIVEIIEKLYLNKQEIKYRMGFDVLKNKIQVINTGNGDTHQYGKSVAEIILCDGSKILYKPHQMKIDERFAELMIWLNSNVDGMLDTLNPNIVCGENYGFAEFIRCKECISEDEVREFYIRCGETLAVLYSLNASDIHYENIISCGKYPVLIDLETLLHILAVKKNDRICNYVGQK